MQTALIVILVMCSPVILAPIVVPMVYRYRQWKTLAALFQVIPPIGEDAPVFPRAFVIEERWRKGRCSKKVEAADSMKECGGHEAKLVELFREEELELLIQRELATVCLLCGHLEKRERGSLALKEDYARAADAQELIRLLQEERERQRLRARANVIS